MLGRWTQQIVTHHRRIEQIIRQSHRKHLVLVVFGIRLTHPHKPELPLIFQPLHRGPQLLNSLRIMVWTNTVPLHHIDIIHLQPLQTALDRINDIRWTRKLITAVMMGVKFSRQNIIIARHTLKRVSENRLTLAIRGSRIKKIDTEIKRALNQTIHTRLINTRLLSHLRRPTAANTHNRNPQTRAAQYAIFHNTSFECIQYRISQHPSPLF